MGALVLFPFFLKGEKTSPAERRRNQKIKKPPPPPLRVFSGFGFGFKKRAESVRLEKEEKIVPTWGELEPLVFFGQRARESSWWNQPRERGKKSELGGCGGPLGEDRFRSVLGFFSFLWCLLQITKSPPFTKSV